ncbi:MAG: hypothetical protein HFG30_06455 [Eubacterium sp.]|nr:hypothetical protein [Eubacterium sp.]
MNFQFMALDETKSETKVHKNIYLFDFFFILIYFTVSAILGNGVSGALRIPYYIYSVICAFWLTSKSQTNERRRNYEAMILFLRKDRTVYRAEKNISMIPESEAEHE